MTNFIVQLPNSSEFITLSGLAEPDKILKEFEERVFDLLKRHNPFEVRRFTNNLRKTTEEGMEAFHDFRKANDDNPIYEDLFINFTANNHTLTDVAKYVEWIYKSDMEELGNEILALM